MGKKFNFRVQVPLWFTRLYPEAAWRIPTGKKVVYLSFDDGPVPEVTASVLSILNHYGIKGTFFCVGDNVCNYPEIFEQIKNEGHVVGNHTYNHLHGIKNTNSVYFENIEKADKLINSDLFRPPYGLLKGSQYWKLKEKYKIILWDVISCDYDPWLSPDECFRNVVDFVRDGSIITFHDSLKAEKNVLNSLPRVIEKLLSDGYTFRKIEFSRTRPIESVSPTHPLQKMRDSFKKHWKRA
jgi:peptidoglycan/xylan/chitin deacetylase (PgdA/CDA1 family)